jgi:alanyl-tRNA synthetase
LALFLNDHNSVWQTDELHELAARVGARLGVDADEVDGDEARSLFIVTDHLRAALVIAAAGIQPSASRQGYVLRKLIRRAVRHGELLQGTDQGLAKALTDATDEVSAVMGRRWPDVGPGAGGDTARETVDKEALKFSKTLRKGVDHLQDLANRSKVFDGDLAFRLADTLGYPVELSAEEALRIGMAIEPGWEQRYEELREEQRARSRR